MATQEPIVGTIHINSKFLFGHTSRNVPIYLFYPYDTSIGPLRVGCSSKEGVNKVALVRWEAHPPGEQYPRGILLQPLGNSGDYVAETLALLHQYIPLRKQIDAIPQIFLPQHDTYADWSHRGFTFNIDPPGCKDIDDCFTIYQKQADGPYFFAISIANLLELVPERSEQDRLAYEQSVTFYENGYALGPMLPRWISEGCASFLEGSERSAITLSCVWDGKTLQPLQFEKTKIHNDKSFTYETILQDIDYAPVLRDIASHLKGRPTDDPHEWVEECMVFYNRQVADLFVKHSKGLLRSLQALEPCRIEQKAALYVAPSKEATHAAFANTHYTHATSPIRRYADILAQRTLASILWSRPSPEAQITSLALDHLNAQMAQSARFERDTFFLRQITRSPSGQIRCTAVGWKQRSSSSWKVYVEVPEWNGRLISISVLGEPTDETTFAFQSKDQKEIFPIVKGQDLDLCYYCDLQQPNWKRRMVCTLKKAS